MPRFYRKHKVRFSDTDHAGLIFYPRYFEALNATVEDWFDHALQISFARFIDRMGLTSPLVSIETRFIGPARLDDELTSALSVRKIGASSLDLCVETLGQDDEPTMRSHLTHVCIRHGTTQSVPWPDEVRAKMQFFKED